MEQKIYRKVFGLAWEKGLWSARILNSVIRCLWPLIRSFHSFKRFCPCFVYILWYFNILWSVFPSRMGLCLPIFISTHIKCYLQWRRYFLSFTRISLQYMRDLFADVYLSIKKIKKKNFYGCNWNVYLYNFVRYLCLNIYRLFSFYSFSCILFFIFFFILFVSLCLIFLLSSFAKHFHTLCIRDNVIVVNNGYRRTKHTNCVYLNRKIMRKLEYNKCVRVWMKIGILNVMKK